MKVYIIIEITGTLPLLHTRNMRCFKSKYRAETILDKLKEQAYELNRQPNRLEKIHYSMEILEVIE